MQPTVDALRLTIRDRLAADADNAILIMATRISSIAFVLCCVFGFAPSAYGQGEPGPVVEPAPGYQSAVPAAAPTDTVPEQARASQPTAAAAQPSEEGIKPLPSSRPKATDAACPLPLFVEDPSKLAHFTRDDEQVHAEASRLATWSKIVWIGAGTGIALGVGMVLLAVGNRFTQEEWTHQNVGMLGGGGAVILSSALLGLVLEPHRTDLLYVINVWNRRHPDRPMFP